MDFKIRIAQQSDSAELRDLYKNTVLVVNRRDYSQDEVEDWASCGDDLSNIEEMIKTHYFIVAVNQLSQIVGFSSITPQGYLHSMFIHADFQGKGIATMLLEEIERYAITKGIIQITSEVSLTARPFFEKQKYVVKKEQKRQANKLNLTNFWMAKTLSVIKPYHGRILLVVCSVAVVQATHEMKKIVREQRKTKPAVKNVEHFTCVALRKE